MSILWTKEEEKILIESVKENAPIKLIQIRMNYAKSARAIISKAQRENLSLGVKGDRAFCEFCFKKLTPENNERVTSEYYNQNYCTSCNIKIESLQSEAIIETMRDDKMFFIASESGTVEKAPPSKLELWGSPTKKCSLCKELVDIQEFQWDIKGKKISCYCKACKNIKSRERKTGIRESAK